MLDYIWLSTIILAVVVEGINGKMEEVTKSAPVMASLSGVQPASFMKRPNRSTISPPNGEKALPSGSCQPCR